MDRRAFLALLASGVVTPLRPAAAQPAARVYRLGILAPTAAPTPSEQNVAVILIPKALREMGYVPARDLVLEARYADGRLDRLPDLARELVRLRVDVIVAISSASVRAAMAATSTEAVPGATRVAFLAPADPGIRPPVQETQQAAASLGIKLAVTRSSSSPRSTACPRSTSGPSTSRTAA
jgi:ABC-type uncharacterized transport system substrate-binding protein